MEKITHSIFEGKFTIDENGCWLLTSCIGNHGYGQIRYGGKKVLAHRLSYSLYKGETNGLHVLHKCDIKNCINPDHLFLGTDKDNSNDRDSKGRQSKGERQPAAKLTEDDVVRIKEAPSYWGVVKVLAERFGVKPCVSSWIRNGKRWTHVS
jgi:hypothetical protein